MRTLQIECTWRHPEDRKWLGTLHRRFVQWRCSLAIFQRPRLNRTRRRIDNLQKIPHRFIALCFGLLGGILSTYLIYRFSPKTYWRFVSVILGLLIGIFFHYLIYRFTLPTKPFVYVAF
jgi:hypothetical protein